MDTEGIKRRLHVLVVIIFVLIAVIVVKSWVPIIMSRNYERTEAVVTDKAERIVPVNACNIHEYKVWYSYESGGEAYENTTAWIEGETSDRMTGIDIRYDRNKPWRSIAEEERKEDVGYAVFFSAVLTVMILAVLMFKFNDIAMARF